MNGAPLPAMATKETPESRPDGKGYIDDASVEALPGNDDQDDDDASGDGSSVEEDRTDDERVHGGWNDGEPGFYNEEAFDDGDELDWGVEDEDWELADGGTFLSWPVFLCRRLLTAKL